MVGLQRGDGVDMCCVGVEVEDMMVVGVAFATEELGEVPGEIQGGRSVVYMEMVSVGDGILGEVVVWNGP